MPPATTILMIQMNVTSGQPCVLRSPYRVSTPQAETNHRPHSGWVTPSAKIFSAGHGAHLVKVTGCTEGKV